MFDGYNYNDVICSKYNFYLKIVQAFSTFI